MRRDHVAVLQLTDLHLFADPWQRFNDVDTRDSFHRVLAHARQHYEPPDAILLTGDLAHDGRPETYRYISDALNVFSVPVFCTLGNHDDPEAARSIYPSQSVSMDDHCLLGSWQVILLDSNHHPVPGDYQGEVSESELRRVSRLTGEYPDRWTLIATHHNLPEHRDRGVAVEVRNHQQVMQHLERLGSVKLVISGHVHQEFLIVQNGVCYLSTPATGYQSTSKSGHVTGEAPGYRWIKLHENGRFETDVRRVNYWAS
jgi:Icc protein